MADNNPAGESTMFSHPGEALKDYGRVIKEYLENKGTDFTPGIGGSVLGAAAGGLTTAKRPNETPAQRAIRTVRNALVGGLLGGVGAQATAFGLGRASSAVEGINPDKEPPKPGSGLGHSPLARTLGAALYPAKQWFNHFRGNPQMEAIDRLFKGDKLDSIQGKSTLHLPGGATITTPFSHKVPGEIRDASAGSRAVAGDWKKKLDALGASKLVDANSMGTVDNTAEALARQIYRNNPGVSQNLGINADLGYMAHRQQTVEALENYLKSRFHVGTDRGTFSRGLRSMEQRLNPHAFSMSGGTRALGGLKTLGGAAAGWFAPDIYDALNAKFNEGGVRLFTPNAPAASTEVKPDDTPAMLRGYQTDFSPAKNMASSALEKILGLFGSDKPEQQ